MKPNINKIAMKIASSQEDHEKIFNKMLVDMSSYYKAINKLEIPKSFLTKFNKLKDEIIALDLEIANKI